MKHKLCISLDQETVLAIMELERKRKYKSRSHVIEVAVQKYLRGEEE